MNELLKIKEKKSSKIALYLFNSIIICFFIYILRCYFDTTDGELDHPAIFGICLFLIFVSTVSIVNLWKAKEPFLTISDQGIMLQRANYEYFINLTNIKRILFFEGESKDHGKWLLIQLNNSLIRPVCLKNFRYKSKNINETLSMLQQKKGIGYKYSQSINLVEDLFTTSEVKPQGEHTTEITIKTEILLIAAFLFLAICVYLEVGQSMKGLIGCTVFTIFSVGLPILSIIDKKDNGEKQLNMNGKGFFNSKGMVLWEHISFLKLESGGKYSYLYAHMKNGDDVLTPDISTIEMEEEASYYAQQFMPIQYC